MIWETFKKHSVEFLLSFYYMYTIFKSSIHLAVCAAQSHEERNISPLIIQAQSISIKNRTLCLGEILTPNAGFIYQLPPERRKSDNWLCSELMPTGRKLGSHPNALVTDSVS